MLRHYTSISRDGNISEAADSTMQAARSKEDVREASSKTVHCVNVRIHLIGYCFGRSLTKT